ncbi:hypothetical protein CTAM01_03924 [Colletotrichum tamarilloi]|uniref:Uncharacterized protein n=1 Tax=Colletotrichum tamarilloi TaxID=1209934 RepID=A0ABQ9RJP8_9PEZI|nr:uncharacterized protein CTAM01_03924 [Colletotrichum tamarilloi]KAK1504617.1 hypothetical protein CTAM01_03924 [Colletotrichum tamarilloi]
MDTPTVSIDYFFFRFSTFSTFPLAKFTTTDH